VDELIQFGLSRTASVGASSQVDGVLRAVQESIDYKSASGRAVDCGRRVTADEWAQFAKALDLSSWTLTGKVELSMPGYSSTRPRLRGCLMSISPRQPCPYGLHAWSVLVSGNAGNTLLDHETENVQRERIISTLTMA